MPNEINSTYMNLPVPVVGVDPGPQYAIDVNSCLTIIDQHTHLAGSGVPITSAAININADLPFNNFNAIDIRAARFHIQPSPIPASGLDLAEIFVSGADLYYNDAVGNQIRITQSGGVVGAPGNITGLTPPASASYVAINQTFVFQSNANTPANLDAASITLRNLVANSKGLTLSPPNSMGADYTITLPVLPVSNLPLSIDSSGTITAALIPITQLSTALQASLTKPPTVQKLVSGSGTYTTPTSPSPKYIKVKMVGGGGGGAEGSTGASTATAGTNSTFGVAFLTAAGGSPGAPSSGGIGGSASINPPAYGDQFVGQTGGAGGQFSPGSSFQATSGYGGSSYFGGGGSSAWESIAGGNGIFGTGSGGGGGSMNTATGGQLGGGGGAGGYLEAFIPNPSATYAYSVGTGGLGGPSNAGFTAGGNGASGQIFIEEYYE